VNFRSPQHLLVEVILVDDASIKENLGKKTVNNMLDFRSPQHLLLEVILGDDACTYCTKENVGKNTVNNMLDFRSPQHLLLEVILVDDASTKENMGKKLGKDMLFIFSFFFL
jgi:hypothetical protein